MSGPGGAMRGPLEGLRAIGPIVQPIVSHFLGAFCALWLDRCHARGAALSHLVGRVISGRCGTAASMFGMKLLIPARRFPAPVVAFSIPCNSISFRAICQPAAAGWLRSISTVFGSAAGALAKASAA